MKNIHILPTDKPSRLVGNDVNQLCYQSNKSYKNDRKWMHRKKFNIYITSDEEIKDGDWYFDENKLKVKRYFKKREAYPSLIHRFEIILTTDQELIKEGVQAIDDEFLNWFIKNPNCESVRIGKGYFKNDYTQSYKIIIPKEEPKQEKLEQIAEEFAIDFAEWCDRSKTFWTPTKDLLEIYKKEKGL